MLAVPKGNLLFNLKNEQNCPWAVSGLKNDTLLFLGPMLVWNIKLNLCTSVNALLLSLLRSYALITEFNSSIDNLSTESIISLTLLLKLFY